MSEKDYYWFYGTADFILCALFNGIGAAIVIRQIARENGAGAITIASLLWLAQFIVLCFLNHGQFIWNVVTAMIRLLLPLLLIVAGLASAAMLYAGLTEPEDRKRNVAVGTVSGGVAVGLWAYLNTMCKSK